MSFFKRIVFIPVLMLWILTGNAQTTITLDKSASKYAAEDMDIIHCIAANQLILDVECVTADYSADATLNLQFKCNGETILDTTCPLTIESKDGVFVLKAKYTIVPETAGDCELKCDFSWKSKSGSQLTSNVVKSIKVWPKIGALKKIEPDSIDYRNNSVATLKAKIEGGYDLGWSFEWLKDGATIGEKTDKYKDLEVKLVNETNDCQIQKYELRCRNSIGTSVIVDERFEYELRVWSEPVYPELNISDGIVRMIEGDSAIVTVGDISGGYWGRSDSWSYYLDNVKTDRREFVFYAKLQENQKESTEAITENHSISLENIGPRNKMWYKKNLDFEIKKYHRPFTPDCLVIKGNGTSRTLVAIMENMEDEELVQQKYTFIFGYTDINGRDIEYPARGNNRYITLDEQAFERINWVYVRKNYSDGVSVTSRKRYISGYCDESFDGSIWDNSRAPETTQISESAVSGIQISRDRFVAEVKEKLSVRLNVYNAFGHLLYERYYAPQYKFDEKLEISDFPIGIYFVEVLIGGQREVKRIYVY